MTLQLKKSGSYTYLYAIKSFRKEDGRCTTKVVEKFGTVEELREKLGGEDPIEWARARVAEMTDAEKEENQNVVVEYNPKSLGRRPRKGLSTTKSEKIQRPQIANSAVWSLELSLFLQNQSVKDRKVVN